MSVAQKLAQERRARLAAERLLELKQAELFDANRKLGQHARKLSDEIEETRAEVATVPTQSRWAATTASRTRASCNTSSFCSARIPR